MTGIAFRALRTRITFFARRAVLAVFWRREFRHFFLHAKFDHRLQFFGVEQHARDITRIDLRIFASRPRFAGIALLAARRRILFQILLDLSVDLLLRNRRRVLARLALRTTLALLGLARFQFGVLRAKFLYFLPHWDKRIRDQRTELDAQRLNVKLHCASSDSIPSRRDT